MRRHLFLISFCAGLLSVPAFAQETCPWAGGDYAFRDHGIYGGFVVDADCTQMTWSRLADGPETSALERTNTGWAGELERATFVLLEDGVHVNLTVLGGAQRRSRVDRQN